MKLSSLRHLLFLFIIFCSPSHAEFYKWLDDNGKVHFSDTPREEGANEAVEIKPAANIGTVKPSSAKHLFKKDFSKRQQTEQARQSQSEKRLKKKTALRKACDDAKQDLATAIERRSGASSPSSKRRYNEHIELAKDRKGAACKLSNFR
jgi:vacuolar-type H+-ATPase subunit I/STV1